MQANRLPWLGCKNTILSAIRGTVFGWPDSQKAWVWSLLSPESSVLYLQVLVPTRAQLYLLSCLLLPYSPKRSHPSPVPLPYSTSALLNSPPSLSVLCTVEFEGSKGDLSPLQAVGAPSLLQCSRNACARRAAVLGVQAGCSHGCYRTHTGRKRPSHGVRVPA